ncbi:ATP-binding protein [Microlunatus sp. Y2014]|uniref:ATP-binding protein n=1 Tax=Microlunatus sp. Y2014 TaxID=3418488 RepID=UPI003DA770C3
MSESAQRSEPLVEVAHTPITSPKAPTGRQMTAGELLLVMLIIVCASVAAVAGTSLLSLRTIEAEEHAYHEQIVPVTRSVQAIRAGMLDAQTNYRGHLLGGSPEMLARFQDRRQVLAGQLEQLRVRAEDVESLDPAEVDALGVALDTWYGDAARQLERRARGEQVSLAESAESFAAASRQLTQFEEQVRDAGDRRLAETRSAIATAWTTGIVATVLAVLITVLVAAAVQRRLVQPLGYLRHVVVSHQAGVRRDWPMPRGGVREVTDLALTLFAYGDVEQAVEEQRVRSIELYALTARTAPVLANADGDDERWASACRMLGEGLAVSRVAVLRLQGETITVLGMWRDPAAPLRETGIEEVPPAEACDLLGPDSATWVARVPDQFDQFPSALARAARAGGAQSAVVVPLAMPHDEWCVLTVGSATQRDWSVDEVESMERVGNQASRALTLDGYLRSRAELDQQKTDFLSTTNHELRTPLTSIAGYLEMISDGDYGPVPDRAVTALGVVERNVVRLRTLIEDLLFINRYDSGRTLGSRATFDLAAVVGSLADLFAPAADDAAVALEIDDGDGPIMVDGDQEQLERSLVNVVSNAIKFTPRGGRVALSVRAFPDDGVVRVTCRDTGMGIPADDVPKLFQRFVRASNAQTEQVSGTGLGLVIVKSVVEAHGGSVGLESVVGEGTVVTLTLPLAGVADPEAGDFTSAEGSG